MAFWSLVTGLGVISLVYFAVRGLSDRPPRSRHEAPPEPELEACPRCGRKTAALEYHRRHCMGRSNPALSSAVRKYETIRRSDVR